VRFPPRLAAPLLLLAVAACSTVSTQEHMLEHFERSDEVQRAIIRGDLEAARAPARWLAEHEHMDLPPSSVVPLEGFRSAARDVAEAPDLEAAAMAAAWAHRACGACHEALGAPRFMVGDAPPERRDMASHTSRHWWAVDRMRTGLSGPSEESWQAGVSALIDTSLDVWIQEASLSGVERARELAGRVHDIAQQVNLARDWDTRTEAFGRLLASCAHCHSERP